MRWRSERELVLEADFEAAVAVEPKATDERIDISSKYSAGAIKRNPWLGMLRVLPNGVRHSLERRKRLPAAISFWEHPYLPLELQ